MKKIFLISGLVVFSSLLLNVAAQPERGGPRTTHKAKKWFKQKVWLNGLQLTPHKSVNVNEFVLQYSLNKPYWDKAFAFLKEHDLKTMAKGRYPIDGDNVYATITEDPSKDFDKTNWESHRKYIDIQSVITGEEKIGVYAVSKATITKEYDESKDLANYSADGKLYSATPGTFFIFFPSDAHRPNITPGGKLVVKKIVIKVKAAQTPLGSNGNVFWQLWRVGSSPLEIGNRLTIAKRSSNKKLTEQLVQRFQPLFGAENTLIQVPDHVNHLLSRPRTHYRRHTWSFAGTIVLDGLTEVIISV